MSRSPRRYPILASFVLVILVTLSACGTGASAGASTTPVASTPTNTPRLATPTSTLVGLCPGTSTRGQIELYAHDKIPLPEGSVVIQQGFGATGSGNGHGAYDFEVDGVCAPALTPDQVRAFYATNMPVQGWTQSATFPYQGDLHTPCGDPYCWMRDVGNNITLYVALENVRSADANTLYSVRVLDYNN